MSINEEKLSKVADVLSELSYEEWIKLRCGVDMAFEEKKRELECNLKLLSGDKIVKAIRARFE